MAIKCGSAGLQFLTYYKLLVIDLPYSVKNGTAGHKKVSVWDSRFTLHLFIKACCNLPCTLFFPGGRNFLTE